MMIPPRHRAWRFIHPDFDGPQERFGLQVSVTGGIGMVEEQASVRQALLLLLSTQPGERVMRPDYGCDLHRLLFSPNDDTTAGLAIHYVRQAVRRWEPRIDLLHLDAERRDHPHCLYIVLDYRARSTLFEDRLVFPLNLGQAEV